VPSAIMFVPTVLGVLIALFLVYYVFPALWLHLISVDDSLDSYHTAQTLVASRLCLLYSKDGSILNPPLPSLSNSQGIRFAKQDLQPTWQNSSSCDTRCLLTCLLPPMFSTDFELLSLALRFKQTIDGGAAFRILARPHGRSTSIVCPEPRHHGWCALARRLAQNKTTKISDLLSSTCPLRDRFHATSTSPLPNSGSRLQAQNTSISCPCLIPIFCLFWIVLNHLSYCILIFFTQIIFLISNSVNYKRSKTKIHEHSQTHSDK